MLYMLNTQMLGKGNKTHIQWDLHVNCFDCPPCVFIRRVRDHAAVPVISAKEILHLQQVLEPIHSRAIEATTLAPDEVR